MTPKNVNLRMYSPIMMEMCNVIKKDFLREKYIKVLRYIMNSKKGSEQIQTKLYLIWAEKKMRSLRSVKAIDSRITLAVSETIDRSP